MIQNRIKELRERKEIRQTEIANYLSIQQNTYSDLERGRTNPSAEILIMLANYYNVSIDYILCQTKNPKRNK